MRMQAALLETLEARLLLSISGWNLQFEAEDTASAYLGYADVETAPYSTFGNMTQPSYTTDAPLGFGYSGAGVVPPNFAWYTGDTSTGFDTQSLALFSHPQPDSLGYIGHVGLDGEPLEGSTIGPWEFAFQISLTTAAQTLDTTYWSIKPGIELVGADGVLAFITYDDGNLILEHGGGSTALVSGFDALTPYTIEADVDMGADTFTVTVDGQQVGGAFEFLNGGYGGITGFEARGGRTGSGEGHYAFYDNISLFAPRAEAAFTYQLPASPVDTTYRVSVGIAPASDPDRIIATFLAGAERTVTAANGGTFTEIWDGRDDNGELLPDVPYVAKAIYMPASQWPRDGELHTLTADYKFLAGDSWGPDDADESNVPWFFGHLATNVVDVSSSVDGKTAFLTYYAENTWNPILADLDEPIGWDQVDVGYDNYLTSGGSTVATDGTYTWAYRQMGDDHYIYRADRGGNSQTLWGPDQFPGGDPSYFFASKRVNAGVPSMTAWRDGAQSYLYVVQRDDADPANNKIQVFDGDAASAALLDEITIATPQAVSMSRSAMGSRLYVLHHDGSDWLVSSIALSGGVLSGGWQTEFTVPGAISNPEDMEIDGNGNFWFTDLQAELVYRTDGSGQNLILLGEGAPASDGAYQPGVFYQPSRLAIYTDTAGDDHVLVVDSGGPGRVSQWSAVGTPVLQREWFLSQVSGVNGYTTDPQNPNHMYMLTNDRQHLVRYDLDYAASSWSVDAVWSLPQGGANNIFVTNRNGHTYVAFGGENYAVYRVNGYDLFASAAVVDGEWWHDADNDGAVDPAEKTGAASVPVSGYFGEVFLDDLTLMAHENANWHALTPASFDAFGNPIYYGTDWSVFSDPIRDLWDTGQPGDPLFGGTEDPASFYSEWADIDGDLSTGVFWSSSFGPPNPAGGSGFNHEHSMAKLTYYQPDGQGGWDLVWRVGQRAGTDGSMTSGEMYLPFRVSGPTDDLVGVFDMFAGMMHFYTTEGLYVDTIGMDASHWDYLENVRRSHTAASGIYYISDGVFQSEHFVDETTGKAYWLVGRGGMGVYEIAGWGAGMVNDLPVTNVGQLVSIEATQPDAYEQNEQPAEFNVSRVGYRGNDLTVYYTVAGSAVSGDDYVALAGSVVIPAGQGSATILLTPIDDDELELVENVTITLSTDAGYVLADADSATAQIRDNEMVVSVNAIDAVADEHPAGGIQLFHDSFEAESDFSHWGGRARPITGAFNAGGEMNYLTGANESSYVQGGAWVVPAVYDFYNPHGSTGFDSQSLSPFTHFWGYANGMMGDASLLSAEGFDGTTTGTWSFSFDLSLSDQHGAVNTSTWLIAPGLRMEAASGGGEMLHIYYDDGDIKVDHGGGTAVLVSGYSPFTPYAIEAQLNMDAGTFEVLVDGQSVGTYSLGGTWSNGIAGYRILGGQPDEAVDGYMEGYLAFYDDIRLATPGEAWRDTATFRFDRGDITLGDLEVFYTLGGRATNGLDFQEVLTGSVIIPDGQTHTDVTITPLDDLTAENASGETLTITLAESGYTIGATTATATILENDLPELSVVAANDTAGEDALPTTVIFDVDFESDAEVDPYWQRVPLPTGPYLPEGGMDAFTWGSSSSYYQGGAWSVTPEFWAWNSEPQTGFDTFSLGVLSHWLGRNTDYPVMGWAGIYGDGLDGTLTDDVRFSFDISMAATMDATDWPEKPGIVLYGDNAEKDALLDVWFSNGDLLINHGGGTAVLVDTYVHYQPYHIEAVLNMSNDTFTVLVDGQQVGSVFLLKESGLGISGLEVSGGQGGDNHSAFYDNFKLEALPRENRGVFTISRNGDGGGDLLVNYSIAGTASSDDYSETLTGSVVIPDGANSVDVTVSPIADGLYEGDENLRLTLVSAETYNVGANGSAKVTILDQRSLVNLELIDANAAETNQDPAVVRFTRDDSLGNVTVHYEATGAASTADVQTVYTGSVTIPDGQTHVDLTLTPTDDDLFEGAEDLTFTIVAGDQYRLGDTLSQTITIADNDDLVVTTTVLDAYGTEGQSAPTIYFENTFSTEQVPSGQRQQVPDTVSYNASGGMTAPTYGSWSGYTFASSGVADPDYTAAGTGFATDALSVYSHWWGDYSGLMGRAGIQGDGFTGTGTGRYLFSFDISLTASGQVDTSDWTLQPGIVLEAAGDTELLEVFLDDGDLMLRHGEGATTLIDDYAVTTPYAIEAVVDMDADLFYMVVDGQIVGGVYQHITPTDNVMLSGYEARGGAGGDNESLFLDNIALQTYVSDSALILVNRNTTLGDTTVSYGLSGAADAADYSESLSGQVVIPAGSDNAVVVITPVDDGQAENNENLLFNVQSGGYVVGSPNQAEVFLLDAGYVLPTVTIVATDADARETGPDGGQFSVTRSTSSGALTVYYSVSGSASAGDIAETLTGSVILPDGQMSVDLPITPIDDAELEGREDVTLTLVADAAYSLGGQAADTVYIADSDMDAGMWYELYALGHGREAVPDLASMQPTSFGSVQGFDLTPGDSNEYFGLRLAGYLQTPETGEYAFHLSSDDGANLYIDGVLIADNDGRHGVYTSSGTIGLSAGYHEIAVEHHAADWGRSLAVEWTGPSFARTAISPDSLFLARPGTDRVSILVDDAQADEQGAEAGTFIVQRDSSAGDLTVHYSLSGSARGDDYAETFTGSVVIPDGQTSVPLTITPVDDAEAEGRETVILTLLEDDAYSLASASHGIVTIADNEPTPMLSHWQLDADLSDATGNGFGAALGGAAAFTADHWQGTHAVDLDGQDAYVINAMDLADLFQDETLVVSLWFRATEPGVIMSELGQNVVNDLWHVSALEVISTGEVRGRFHGLNWLELGTVDFGEWHHVALRYDAATGALEGFLDGTRSSQTVYGDRSTSVEGGQGSFFAFGAPDGTHLGDGTALGGQVDDIRIYGQYVPDGEIASQAGQGLPEVQLVATDPSTTEGAGDPATVTFSRTSTTGDLTVYYQYTGSAGVGDYAETLTGSVVIPDGESTAAIDMTAVEDPDVEGYETIVLSIMGGDGDYAPGADRQATVYIHDNDLGSSAALVAIDEASQGDWEGLYGDEGYNILQHTDTTPSYVTVTPTNYQAGTWTGSSTDPRALKLPAPSDQRYVGVWYGSPTWSIDMNITDGQAHQVALYVIDWDHGNRSQSIDVVDVATDTVLTSITVGDFDDGVWLVYDLQGHVRFDFTTVQGANAVLTGIMFDPVQTGPAVSVAATDPDADEATGDPGRFTVSRQGIVGDLTVHYALEGLADASDYAETLTGSVVIPDGASSVDLTITPIDDDTAEYDEPLTLTLLKDAGYRLGSGAAATVTIADDDPTPTVGHWMMDNSAADSSGFGNALVLNGGAAFTSDSGQGTHALDLDGANDHAFTGGDMRPLFDDSSVTIALWFKADDPGVILTELAGPAVNHGGWHDSQIEVLSDGTLKVRVWQLPAVTVGTVDFGIWHHVTLRYNEATQTLNGFLDGVAAGGSSTGTRSWPGTLTYGIGCAESTNMGDGTYFGGQVDDLRIYKVPLEDDEIASLAVAKPAINLVASDADASELGPDAGSFTIQRTRGDEEITVYYQVAGSASAGDYVETLTGSIVIPEGQPSAVLTITPLDDAETEYDETVTITLLADDAYEIGLPEEATVTIADSDLPTVSIEALPATAAEGGSAGAFVLTRDSDVGDVTVMYQISGSASSADVAESFAGSVLMPDGQLSVALPVTAVDDSLKEGTESLDITLIAGDNYFLGGFGLASISLIDNDVAYVTVQATDGIAVEAGADPGVFTLTRTDTVGDLEVAYILSGSAEAGDYSETLDGTVTIPDGQASVTITVTPIDDGSPEGAETLILQIVNANPPAGTPSLYDDFQVDHGDVAPNNNGNSGTLWQTIDDNWQRANDRAQSNLGGDSASGRLVSAPITVEFGTMLAFDLSGKSGLNGFIPSLSFISTANAASANRVVVHGDTADGPVISTFVHGSTDTNTMLLDPRGFQQVVIEVIDESGTSGYDTDWLALDVVQTVAATEFSPLGAENYADWQFLTTAGAPGGGWEAMHWSSRGVSQPFPTEGGALASSARYEWKTGMLRSDELVVAGDTLKWEAAGWSASGANFFRLLDEVGNEIYDVTPGDLRISPPDQDGFVTMSANLADYGLAEGDRFRFEAVDGSAGGSSAWMAFDYLRHNGGAFGVSYGIGEPSQATVEIRDESATPTPSMPDLVPTSDTGGSDADNVTRLDNSEPGKAMQFAVGNTVPGATVTLYADGAAIGSALAAGATTTVTTDGLFDLADGQHNITAIQQLPGQDPSASSPALTVTVDTTPVRMTASSLDAGLSDPWLVSEIVLTFADGDVSAELSADDLSISYTDTTGAHSIDPADMAMTYQHNPGSDDTATWTFPGLAGGVLPDGLYTVTLPGGTAADEAGNALDADNDGAAGGDYLAAFVHAIPGDANLDGNVDLTDLATLASHYNQSGLDWMAGDFSGDGTVGLVDLSILASQWGNQRQPAPPASLVEQTAEVLSQSSEPNLDSATASLESSEPAEQDSTVDLLVLATTPLAQPTLIQIDAGTTDTSVESDPEETGFTLPADSYGLPLSPGNDLDDDLEIDLAWNDVPGQVLPR